MASPTESESKTARKGILKMFCPIVPYGLLGVVDNLQLHIGFTSIQQEYEKRGNAGRHEGVNDFLTKGVTLSEIHEASKAPSQQNGTFHK
ncbi:hypothetical protein FKM82_028542 [Ascaphus truei]